MGIVTLSSMHNSVMLTAPLYCMKRTVAEDYVSVYIVAGEVGFVSVPGLYCI